MGPAANQGATTLCTFYANNAVQEASATKILLDTGEEKLMKMADYHSWKRPSEIPERCVLDPFMDTICQAIYEKFDQPDDLIEDLKSLPMTPRSRTKKLSSNFPGTY